MPPKGKAAQKPKEPEPAPPAPPKTINEQSQQRFEQTNPFHKAIAEKGLSGLSAAERTAWASSHYTRPSAVKKLANKTQRELWRNINENSLPLRSLKQPTDWGKDRYGRDIGEYTPEQFQERFIKRNTLVALAAAHQAFLAKRKWAAQGAVHPDTKEVFTITDEDIEEERQRRYDLATLRMELYGQKRGLYENDPDWDDVIPIPQDEPEGALAAIAYPEHYAEAISYLRAVMVANEYTARSLRLTEHVISMNPAHYTVWLYRFSIVVSLDISIPDEIEWVNEVALQHLKNYQIWHHRHLLIDHYFPQISSSQEKVSDLAKSESEFLRVILAEDTKNYHVWSYRQYLVRKLSNWSEDELKATEQFVIDDVRNNSAWSHRFFLVFSDPKTTTAGSHSTEYDPAVPAEIIDREVKYAEEKIVLAPQNQSPWNYLKGVLVKGGRKLGTVEEFASQFVANMGDEEKEDVKSTHALDLLAEIYAEKGEKEKADLYLKRLGEKWDRIRTGYWEWRRKLAGS